MDLRMMLLLAGLFLASLGFVRWLGRASEREL